MDTLRKLAVVGLVIGALVAGAGCGSGSDRSAPTTTSAPKRDGGKVDLSSKDDSITYTGKDGNTFQYGGTSLPKGWPKALTPPDGVDLVSSSTVTQGGKKVLFVTATSSAPVATLYDGLKAQLTAAGYDITSATSAEGVAGTGPVAGVEADDDAFSASVSISQDTATKKTTILFSLTAKA